ncbi:RagB/SusD family nutrient uptake outer membrane protein [Tenacibaculum mesophilum]|uniref:RagB/SusD family nutrient uptake outer membrane protein n=1 Tax=Tenacibaculum mesophilum TaxID=104268 RepID=A0AAE9MM20_9FLAO|nr:RagB/SusD family nutrient uptake outer membrane protein [Tenacibaculum mesophilum]UTD15802.1 RagB/SusD family nutrient uptake outer membrane protein [Tenacibaculum mesophilum]
MIKNKINKVILYATLAFTFVGCSEYLSELPDNRTLIDSPDKVSQLITAAYPDQDYALMAEIMSDNADDKGNVSNVEQLDLQLYQWQDSNLEERGSPVNYWNSCYEAISQANQALASIEELKNKFDLNAQKGEALIARAYAHFMLVNFWAKHYDANTASTDLGIPYVLEPETVLFKTYKRNTVQEVYDLIEKDLIKGLSMVGDNYNSPKFHFTKDAANAFAARFYLYKGQWDKVIEHADKVVTNPVSEARNMVAYGNMNLTGIRMLYNSVDEPANLLIISTNSIWARRHRSSRFGLSVDKIRPQLFTGSSNPFKKNWAYDLYRGNQYTYFTPKYNEYFKYTNESAGIGLPFLAQTMFDKDEVILNRAEASAMLENYSDALMYLNAYIANKTQDYDPNSDMLTESLIQSEYPVIANEYTPAYGLNDKQTSFIKAIAEFKRRQFYHEGFRWFDVRRFNLSITHELDNGSDVMLEKQDLRKQLQIPLTAQNGGLQQNPR